MNKELNNIFNNIKSNLDNNNDLENKNAKNINFAINILLNNLSQFIKENNIAINLSNLDCTLNNWAIELIIPVLEEKTIFFNNFLLTEVNNLQVSFNNENNISTFDFYLNLTEYFTANINRLEDLDTIYLSNIFLEKTSEFLLINNNSIEYPKLKNIISKEIKQISRNFQNDKKVIIQNLISPDLVRIIILINKLLEQEQESLEELNSNTNIDNISNEDKTIEIDDSIKFKLAKEGILNIKDFLDTDIINDLKDKKNIILTNFRNLRSNINKLLIANNLFKLKSFHYILIANEHDVIFNNNILKKLLNESNLSFKSQLNTSINTKELIDSKKSNTILNEFNTSIINLLNLIYNDIIIENNIQSDSELASRLLEVIDEYEKKIIKEITYIYKYICNKTYKKIEIESNLKQNCKELSK